MIAYKSGGILGTIVPGDIGGGIVKYAESLKSIPRGGQ